MSKVSMQYYHKYLNKWMKKLYDLIRDVSKPFLNLLLYLLQVYIRFLINFCCVNNMISKRYLGHLHVKDEGV